MEVWVATIKRRASWGNPSPGSNHLLVFPRDNNEGMEVAKERIEELHGEGYVVRLDLVILSDEASVGMTLNEYYERGRLDLVNELVNSGWKIKLPSKLTRQDRTILKGEERKRKTR